LVLPYGTCDVAIRIALIDLDVLLQELLGEGSAPEG
jgi:hypothetical protein